MQVERSSKREKAIVKIVRKGCGKVETVEGTANVEICFSREDNALSSKQLVRSTRLKT